MSSAKILYDQLNTYRDLIQLIDDGETESVIMECKAPLAPKINIDLQIKISKALSGFGNTTGGIIIWGISTTSKGHSGLDVLSQIEPIGSITSFKKQIDNKIPTLSIPNLTECETKSY